MCFQSKNTKTVHQLETRFEAPFMEPEWYTPGFYNGFTFPKTPVIANNQAATIQLFNWGLIPFWAKDQSIRKHTLNAREETLDQKPSFKPSLHQRCLILADGFFEWQWLDAKGKQKKKFLLTLPGEEAFAFAGLWSAWTDPGSGEIHHTYTIITTAANELMSKIHNSRKRMPVIVAPEAEKEWLKGSPLLTQNDRLVAVEEG